MASCGSGKGKEKEGNEAPFTAIRIFPPIGLGRVGNATDEWFLAPEVPYQAATDRKLREESKDEAVRKEAELFAPTRFKDEHGGIKPQAVRYRIYGEDANGNVTELNLEEDSVESIEWIVHVMNKKASWNSFMGELHLPEAANSPRNPLVTDVEDRKAMHIDPKLQVLSVSRANKSDDDFLLFGRHERELVGEFNCGSTDPNKVKIGTNWAGERVTSRQLLPEAVEVSLGALNADKTGRLVFFPSTGESFGHPKEENIRILEEFNNINRYDNACDGPVHAIVRFKNGTHLDTRTWGGHAGAWIIVGPPNFAPELNSVTSMVDISVDATLEQVQNKDGTYSEAVPYPGEKVAGVKEDSHLSGYPLAREEFHCEGDVGYYRHIYPMMAAATGYSWTNMMAYTGHAPGRQGDFVNSDQQKVYSDTSDASKPYRKNFFFRMRGFDRKDMRRFYQNRDQGPLFNPETKTPPLPDETVSTLQSEGESIRIGEAKKFFMPRLGGNDGGFEDYTATDKDADGSPDSFFSMLPHQMTKLRKWSDGEFIVESPQPPTYEFLSQVSVENQPNQLTLGALLPLVGGSFHPGMEYTFISRLSQYYCEPFRFAYGEKVYLNSQRAVLTPGDQGQELGPGDITKWMALPWQSDFYGCRLIWWPANRPDTVVTEEEYNAVWERRKKALSLEKGSKEEEEFLKEENHRRHVTQLATAAVDASTSLVSFKPLRHADQFEDISTLLTERVMWDRGLHTLPVEFKHVDTFPKLAFEDMTNYWHKLGFVVSKKSGGEGARENVWVETERDKKFRETVPELNFSADGSRIVYEEKPEIIPENINLKKIAKNSHLFADDCSDQSLPYAPDSTCSAESSSSSSSSSPPSAENEDLASAFDDKEQKTREGVHMCKKQRRPRKELGKWTVKDLHDHLKWAIDVELATIPLYLSSLYSVRQTPLDPLSPHAGVQTEILRELTSMIRSVVVEEMLHLALATNVFIAVGGKMKGEGCVSIEDDIVAQLKGEEVKKVDLPEDMVMFFGDVIKAEYPTEMSCLHHNPETNFELHLGRADASQLKSFLKIEEPRTKCDVEEKFDHYDTIGQLYDSIQGGIEELLKRGIDLFAEKDPEEQQRRRNLQLPPGVGYAGSAPDAGHRGGGLVLVSCLKDAKDAFATIVDQGEGNTDSLSSETAIAVRVFLNHPCELTLKQKALLKKLERNPQPFDNQKLELSHFQRFFLAYAAVKRFPDKNLIYPVIQDAKTSDLKKWGFDNIHQLSLCFDAVFTYQLAIIELLYSVSDPTTKEILVKGGLFTVMLSVTGSLGRLLTRTEFKHPSGEVLTAGCAFERYEWTTNEEKTKFVPTRKEQMVALLQQASAYYMADLGQALEVAKKVLDIDKELLVPDNDL